MGCSASPTARRLARPGSIRHGGRCGSADQLSLRQQYKPRFAAQNDFQDRFCPQRCAARHLSQLNIRPGERTTDELLDELCRRYEAQGLIRGKRRCARFGRWAFASALTIASRWLRCMCRCGWTPRSTARQPLCQRRVGLCLCGGQRAGLEIDKTELALILLNDGEHTGTSGGICCKTWKRAGWSSSPEERYALPGLAPSCRQAGAAADRLRHQRHPAARQYAAQRPEGARSRPPCCNVRRILRLGAQLPDGVSPAMGRGRGGRARRRARRPALVHGFLRFGAPANCRRFTATTPIHALLSRLLLPGAGGRPAVEAGCAAINPMLSY